MRLCLVRLFTLEHAGVVPFVVQAQLGHRSLEDHRHLDGRALGARGAHDDAGMLLLLRRPREHLQRRVRRAARVTFATAAQLGWEPLHPVAARRVCVRSQQQLEASQRGRMRRTVQRA